MNTSASTSASLSNISLDILIRYDQISEKYYYPNFQANLLADSTKIDFSSLYSDLKQRGLVDFPGIIFYYDHIQDAFIYICHDSDHDNKIIPFTALYNDKRLVLTLRIKPVSEKKPAKKMTLNEEVDQYFSFIESETDPENSLAPTKCICTDEEDEIKEEGQEEEIENFKSQRGKERKISEVLNLLAKWRRLSISNIDEETGLSKKRSLEDAAKIVGVSNKSLGDYQTMVRKAQKFGFNFAANQDKGFGILRKFILEEKEKQAQVTERVTRNSRKIKKI